MTAMFTGVETAGWSHQDFLNTAERLKSDGIDTWFLKVADGTSVWYGGLSMLLPRLSQLSAIIDIVPYIYSYGDTYGGLVPEIAVLNALIHAGYVPCIDMETEWNGHSDWATTLAENIAKPLYICTWADPSYQRFSGVLAALKEHTYRFLPMVYSSWLAVVWKAEYLASGIDLASCIPLFDASIYSKLDPPGDFALWELQSLNDTMIRSITMPQTAPSSFMIKQAADCWQSAYTYMKDLPPYTTGIAESWKTLYYQGKKLGPPCTNEYTSVDWAGNSINVQEFLRARAEWNNKTGTCTWFDFNGEHIA